MQSTDDDNRNWAQLHSQLQDQLAGYVDGELDAGQRTVIEAHLAGCSACRADMKRQQILHQRLRNLPAQSLSAAQDAMFDDMINGVMKSRPNRVPGAFAAIRAIGQRLARRHQPLLLGSGWAVALLLAVVMFMPDYSGHAGKTNIPMVDDVVAEYRTIDLDARVQAAPSPEVTLPVSWPGARVLASWTTLIGGAPAQAYAVRSGHYLLFQYRVEESVFYRNPRVRDAVAREGRFKQRSDQLEVLALPNWESGVLMVGPPGSIPAVKQLQNPAET